MSGSIGLAARSRRDVPAQRLSQMSTTAALHDGREAFRARNWAEAYVRLAEAGSSPEFQLEDLESLAISAYLAASDDKSEDAWIRAHQEYLQAGDVARAVRCAFWLVMQLLSLRESARASGWLATAQRLLTGCDRELAEEGLLLVIDVRTQLRDGKVAAAQDASDRAAALAARFADADLRAFALLAQGLTCASCQRWDAARAAFDEAMVAIAVDEVSPVTAGIMYCAVIDACYQMADLARAREWTETFARWCGGQPELVAFRGHCGVHRAQTMRFGGHWSNALAEAVQVCRVAAGDESVTPSWRGLPAGAACYEIAEVHRMRGEFAEADEAYREASRHGRSPDPGLPLLRLAQGRHANAAASIRRALEVPCPPASRALLLAAGVEIGIACGDLRAARRSADELAEISEALPTPFLHALSAQGLGAVLLAEGDARSALAQLRDAWMAWQDLEIPYDAARVRVLMGLACRDLGDCDAASMECAAARRVFERLGAAADVTRVDDLLGQHTDASLTPREVEVIKLVASGRTNRAIARVLGISERTVDRHLSNILTKLDLSSRTAAAAYAYEHGLV